MKTLTAILVVLTACATWAYDAPSDQQIEQLLADPGGMKSLIKGASAEEAASVLQRAIQAVEQSNLDADGKAQTVALLSARFTKALGGKAGDALGILLGNIDAQWHDEVVAAAMLSGNQSKLREALGGMEGISGALNEPEATLGPYLTALVGQTVGTGIATPASPAGVPGSMPNPTPPAGAIPPPPVPSGTPMTIAPAAAPAPTPTPSRGRPSPPVPEPYAGQD